MRWISIETTPNPNSMKLNLDARLGNAATFTRALAETCPASLRPLLGIAGVESVFVCADFVTLNRDPRAPWEPILEAARRVLAGEIAAPEAVRRAAEKLGQVAVTVQTFRHVPIQVKATDGATEKRIALDPRFARTAQAIQARTGADYLKERAWVAHGVRYGTVDEVAAAVAEELDAVLDDRALTRIQAEATGDAAPPAHASGAAEADLSSDDWRRRLRAIERAGAGEGAIPELARALHDPSAPIRRFAAAALGATRSRAAVPHLCLALGDASVAVRRTAGDALSDLGDAGAEGAMCAALADSNKLVRWRAARFLTEVGTTLSLGALEKAAGDPEFEVRLEVEAAIQRIRGGGQAAGPVWKRMTEG
jgi:hypothetical protein